MIVGRFNLRIVDSDLFPFLSGVFVEPDVVLVSWNLIFLDLWHCRVIDIDAVFAIVHDSVAIDLCGGVTQQVDAMSLVLLDLVALDGSLRVEENNAILLILLNDVRGNEEVEASFDYKDSFLFALFNVVVLDLGGSRSFSSQSDIGSEILGNVVRKDVSSTTLFQEDALVVILLNTVAHGVFLVDHLFSDMLFEDDCSIYDIVECRETIIVKVDSFLKELCIIPSKFFEVQVAHLCVEICELVTTDVSAGIFCKFNTSFTIGFDDICSNLWPASGTLANNSIMSWSLNIIFLNCWLTWSGRIITSNQYPIIRTLLNGVFKNDRIIIDKLNCTFVNLHLVHSNKGINRGVNYNCGALANHENIVEDNRMWFLSLDVEACSTTRDHSVVSEDEDISLREVGDHTALTELVELAVLNDWGALIVVDARGYGVLHASTAEWASLDEAGGIWFLVDAGSLVF
jgi:hypothetical protein